MRDVHGTALSSPLTVSPFLFLVSVFSAIPVRATPPRTYSLMSFSTIRRSVSPPSVVFFDPSLISMTYHSVCQNPSTENLLQPASLPSG